MTVYELMAMLGDMERDKEVRIVAPDAESIQEDGTVNIDSIKQSESDDAVLIITRND